MSTQYVDAAAQPSESRDLELAYFSRPWCCYILAALYLRSRYNCFKSETVLKHEKRVEILMVVKAVLLPRVMADGWQ